MPSKPEDAESGELVEKLLHNAWPATGDINAMLFRKKKWVSESCAATRPAVWLWLRVSG